ncbi:sterol desaturase family protein [Pedobacter sp. AW1-32]|uniref:sterol desaturase family protein n=1 Tax=Pedobacter sp. AW1-32 TaxID=3383026 RepID=UPI003FED4DCE
MNVILSATTLIVTIIIMECLSWFIHKYLFHGPLWFIHKSHHQHTHSTFELNDVFAVFFAAVSLYLMYIDRFNFGYLFFIGLGITGYGLIYFIVHDWFIHKRFQPFRANNGYLIRLRKAHKIHHKNREKEKGKAFGLLFVSKNIVNKSTPQQSKIK